MQLKKTGKSDEIIEEIENYVREDKNSLVRERKTQGKTKVKRIEI